MKKTFKILEEHPKSRTLNVDIKIGASSQIMSVPQSVRGSFEENTLRLIPSKIIHLMIYEPELNTLYLQLTSIEGWKDYTYFDVTFNKFKQFKESVRNGRLTNKKDIDKILKNE
ncbi:hypothetical protein LCGC14_1250170 [marine sediment metagenome]|uniref:Uncharacterized protein n=1 Tax=marine sediment metagenome TaxID=412755 RepID=A0A0F9LQ69_9ZZZZ